MAVHPVIHNYPSPDILRKLVKCVPDAGVQVFNTMPLVQDHVHAAERREQDARLRRAFWQGFWQGFGALALLFNRRGATPAPARPASATLDPIGWAVGHSMRCAIHVVMDRHGLTPQSMGLTPREIIDLVSYQRPECHGHGRYAQARAALARENAARPATPASHVA